MENETRLQIVLLNKTAQANLQGPHAAYDYLIIGIHKCSIYSVSPRQDWPSIAMLRYSFKLLVIHPQADGLHHNVAMELDPNIGS